VGWPTPQEYNEAIQNPAANFADRELAAGQPELTPLGLPRPVTGNFASVYRLHCGRRDLAVRCFWREYADMQQRYGAISRHLRQVHLPYTVDFEYLPRGIRIGGQWYPVLKMEWVEGDLLVPYIERHLDDPAALNALAERWRQMAGDLERADVAHGDLQHGNVLIVRDRPVLVDYDGMFVPALRGLGSHELGHQHYQHPRRSADDFDLWTDRVSALVIYVSLRALACRPDLWDQLTGGDEALLLRRSDLADPPASPAFQLLASCPDRQLRNALAVLQRALTASPDAAPTLSAVEQEGRRSFGHFSLRQRLLFTFRHPKPATAPGAIASPPWLADHLHDPPITFRPLGRSLRLTAAASALAIPVSLSVDAALTIAPLALAALAAALLLLWNLVHLLIRYRGDPGVIMLRTISGKERAATRELSSAENAIRRLERRRSMRLGRLDRRLGGAQRRRREVAESEARELQLAAAQCEDALRRLDELLQRLAERERAAVESAIAALQARHVREHLLHCRLQPDVLPGIGRTRVLRLWLAGIRSAADLSSQSIERLRRAGEPGLNALVAWRVDCELQARRSIPRVLPPEMLGRLTHEFGAQRASLDEQRRRAQERERALLAAIHARYQAKYRPIDAELHHLEAERAEARDSFDARLSVLHERRAAASARVSRIRREIEPYRHLTFTRYVRVAVLPAPRAAVPPPGSSLTESK
jgi:hypothetical protein